MSPGLICDALSWAGSGQLGGQSSAQSSPASPMPRFRSAPFAADGNETDEGIGTMMLHPERARTIPTEAGKALLREWVESSANVGEHGSRVLHIKSLHTKRGFGAKLAGFFWLDVPFRAAGGAVRAAYQPGASCPLCASLAEEGFNARGKAVRTPNWEHAEEVPREADPSTARESGTSPSIAQDTAPRKLPPWDEEPAVDVDVDKEPFARDVVDDGSSNSVHEVFDIEGLYVCAGDECDFETASQRAAREHDGSYTERVRVPKGQTLPDRLSIKEHAVFDIEGLYVCVADDCDFETTSMWAARGHGEEQARHSPSESPHVAAHTTGIDPGMLPPALQPGFKICPDCAEEVRFAARKCRFCSYLFTSGDGAA